MKFLYITNDPARAAMAQAAGTDRIMVDLEINGKDARQGHLNTVISRHTPDDIDTLRAVVSDSELMVRVNPLFEGTAAEVDDCLARGAERLMLPMFQHPDEVSRFLDIVAGRAPVTLLLETPAALARIGAIAEAAQGAADIHLGLNDLHLGLGLDFMFEVMSEGLLDHAAGVLRAQGTTFGIGGIARLGAGLLPAELVLSEHLRVGSTAMILSRDFNALFDTAPDPGAAFAGEVAKLRDFLRAAATRATADFEADRTAMRTAVRRIVATRRAKAT